MYYDYQAPSCHVAMPKSAHRRRKPLSGMSPSQCTCNKAVVASIAAVALGAITSTAQQSQPNPCIRWAHSSTLGASSSNSSAQSTLYVYGGDAKTQTSQTTNTRTNALIALDVSTNWSIANPPLTLVKPDNGNSYDPPQTSLGAMFSSQDGQNLYCA